MRRFLKPEIVNEKNGKEILQIDVASKSNQLPLNKVNFGTSTRNEANKMKSSIRKEELLENFQSGFVKLTKYLQGHLPLDSQLLMSLRALHPIYRKQSFTVPAIKKLCLMMPHVVDNKVDNTYF